MSRRSSLFPAAFSGSEASEARKRFEAASNILQGASTNSRIPPSPESLQKAMRVRELASKLVALLEAGITFTTVKSIDDAAKSLVTECLLVQNMTLSALSTRKNQ